MSIFNQQSDVPPRTANNQQMASALIEKQQSLLNSMEQVFKVLCNDRPAFVHTSHSAG